MIDMTIMELITELKKPGKAFITMAGTELLVEIVKSDLIKLLSTVANKSHTQTLEKKMYCIQRNSWGTIVEVN